MAQALVEMAVAIAWAARAAEAEAEAAWLRLQPSPEGGLQPSLGRTTWRATEAPRFARSEEVRLRAIKNFCRLREFLRASPSKEKVSQFQFSFVAVPPRILHR